MYTAKKIFLTSVTILALAGFMTGGQSWAALDLVNEETGFDSENRVTAEKEVDFDFSNDNDETILNLAQAFSNTGENEFEDAFDGDLETGEIDIEGIFENEFNLNQLELSGGSSEDGLIGNNETGAFSDNEASAVIEEELEIENDNDLDLTNNLLVDANTGDNVVEDADDASLSTGDAVAELELENAANRNLIEAEGSLGIGSLDVFNEETGAFSDNVALLEFESEVEIENENDADIDNNIFIALETGNNVIEDNCGDAEIETGDAVAEVAISNDVNRNVLNVEFAENDSENCPGGRSNCEGDCDDCSFEFTCNGGACDECDDCGDICDTCEGNDGLIRVFNEETGFDSENVAFAEIESELEIESENNADIDNNIVLDLSTGFNEAEDNFGDAAIESGDAEAEVEIENIINRNQTDVQWGFGSSIEVGNEETGEGSENEVVVQIEDEVEIESENDADIDNLVNVVLNTGYNSAEDNGGCADVDIETGDAQADIQIVNQVNSNVTNVDLGGGSDIEAVNEETGCDSDNEASVEVSRNVEINNENNAEINNVITVVSNTGGNEADDNVGDAGISSGSSSVFFGATNSGNLNMTDIAL